MQVFLPDDSYRENFPRINGIIIPSEHNSVAPFLSSEMSLNYHVSDNPLTYIFMNLPTDRSFQNQSIIVCTPPMLLLVLVSLRFPNVDELSI